MATVMLDPYNGGLAATRALVRRGEDVIVVAGPNNRHTARTRGVEGHAAPSEEWPDLLADIAARRGPGPILTGADLASAWLVDHRDALPDGLRAFEAADDAHLPLMRKDDSEAIARRAGVAVPWSAVIEDAASLESAAAAAPYPAILKPVLSHAWRAVFGDDRVTLVQTPDEARRAGERALQAGLAMVMGEYIPGGDDCVEEALIVRDAEGEYPVFFGCAKIRQYPVGFGAASLCEAAELPETIALAKAVLDEGGFVGVAGVETKRHAQTGRRYFLEVNVRIATQWGLGDASGLDASARLAAVARGERVGPQAPMRRRARLVFPELDVRAAAAALRASPEGRFAAARELTASYKGVRELGLLDPRDPGPLAAYVGNALRRRLSRT
jgi:predicted ATP-grasp superfamily ATP-dependent carboligase